MVSVGVAMVVSVPGEAHGLHRLPTMGGVDLHPLVRRPVCWGQVLPDEASGLSGLMKGDVR